MKLFALWDLRLLDLRLLDLRLLDLSIMMLLPKRLKLGALAIGLVLMAPPITALLANTARTGTPSGGRSAGICATGLIGCAGAVTCAISHSGSISG